MNILCTDLCVGMGFFFFSWIDTYENNVLARWYGRHMFNF